MFTINKIYTITSVTVREIKGRELLELYMTSDSQPLIDSISECLEYYPFNKGQ